MLASVPKKNIENQGQEQFSVDAHPINPSLNYGGDVSAVEACRVLAEHGGLLVDVRTVPEWQFVGVPDISATKGSFATISWKHYPTMQTNPDFLSQLAEACATPDTKLFFLCRSGGRSLDAALAATQAGYRFCYNVAGGFEGEVDAKGHRATLSGWKASQLAWKQG